MEINTPIAVKIKKVNTGIYLFHVFSSMEYDPSKEINLLPLYPGFLR
jgi:hypothetical protein